MNKKLKMPYEEEKLLGLLENLFNPIDNKDYGLYWNVSNNKIKPLANAKELLKYIRRESKEGSFINRYANLEEDLVLENNIYLDFDLTNKDYLKAEKYLTEKTLKSLSSEEIDVESSNYHEKNNNIVLKQIQSKYKEDYTVENGFIKGFNNFIDSLTLAEEGALKNLVANYEKEEIKGLNDQEIQQYYIKKFEHDYLKEPFKETITVAKYFESIGVKAVINFSGSKGLHLRIPITTIKFNDIPDLAENPENVKLFLEKLAELIETKILKKPYKKSSLDYAVFKKGMQRLPTSKHNKTKLYANFIDSSFKYIEAIDYLEEKDPIYIPETVDLKENTKLFIESDIFKATVNLAKEEATKTFKFEATNSNYKFKGEHKELLEIISKVYLPSVRNEVGFRIVHLLRRSKFSQEEVENIFKQLHTDITDYNKTIRGSIKHAYKTEKLTGLKSLIKWLKANASEEVKEEVINYFQRHFNYYEVPVETTLENSLLIHGKEHEIIEVTTSTNKYYVLKNLDDVEGNNLEIHKELEVLYFKQHGKLIAKLELKQGKQGLIPHSQDVLEKFIDRVNKKIEMDKEIVSEAIEELDVYFEEFEEKKKQEKEITKNTDSNSENDLSFTFGNAVKRPDGYYKMNDTGITFNTIGKDDTVIITRVANIVIENITIILDELKIADPVYNIHYKNLTFNKTVTKEYLNSSQLIDEIISAKVFNNPNRNEVETVINSFIITGTRIKKKVEVKEEAYLKGFFLLDGKVRNNTELPEKYEKKELKEAITLLNNIMNENDRSDEGKKNDSAVYRFMLWSPFSYCLKQLGYGDSNYSLILIGKSQTNKTGATNIGRLFYLHNEEETTGSSVSVLGSKLEENSFVSIFDECSHLFKLNESQNIMKRSIYEKTTRATKDRNDNKKIDEFKALGLPVFILNEREEFKDYIINRYKIIEYTDKSYISKGDKQSFNKKYVPKSPDTILKKLCIIGKAFSEKLIKIIEDPTKRKKLFNMEEITTEILKEIGEEAGVNFIQEMLEFTESSENYNYDVKSEINKLLNDEFKKKNRLMGNNTYSGNSFVHSINHNDFEFIIYNKYRNETSSEKEFLIKAKGLEDYVNNNIEEQVSLEAILDYLDLTDILEEKLKAEKYPEDFSSYIRKQNYIKVEGTKKGKYKEMNIRGFFLTVEELANKLFSFNINFSEK